MGPIGSSTAASNTSHETASQDDGKIRHLGLSQVSVDQIKKAQELFTVTSVQNRYSIVDRTSEPVLDYCLAHGIAFIPWFPIGGGTIDERATLSEIANAHGVGERQVALAWLLHHADNILLIPGTSNLSHLEGDTRRPKLEATRDSRLSTSTTSGSRPGWARLVP